jgi:predicted Zn-dependent peptidase
MKTLALLPLLLLTLQAQPPAAVKSAPAKAAAARPAVGSLESLKFPPLSAVSIPKPEVFRLPNGMKIYLLEDHELPLVRGIALVRTGALLDPKEKVGLASMTGTVLRSGGTKAKTGDQLDQQLENIAASVESGVGDSSGTVSFSCLKENLDEVLGVYHDVMTAPEFRQDKLDLLKTQMRSSIARRNDSPAGIAAREFTNTLYGKDTPFGREVEYAHVNAISRADLKAFYERYYFPANVMLAVYGDFDTAAMRARLEKTFADWSVKQDPIASFPQVTAAAAPGVYLAEKEDTTQTFFYVGQLATTLRDKDYAALSVMADILGGGFSSRLLNHIRTQLGYAYHISADWGAEYNFPGLFTISGSTKSGKTVDTLEAVRQDVEAMRNAPVTAEELATSKDKVLNSFVFNFDRPSKTLNRMLLYDYFGYPADFIFTFQKGVRDTTAADVQRVAKEHIDLAKLTYVVVGKSADFGRPLAELKLPVNKVDLTIPEPKAETAASDAASLAKGKQMLARAQQAMGGADKLAGVKDYSETVEKTLVGMGGMKVQELNRRIGVTQLRQDLTLPFGKQVVYFDGKSGWIHSPRGLMPMPAPVLNQVKDAIFRDLFSLLLSDREAGRVVNFVGSATVEISDKDGHSVRVKFDEATGLPARLFYSQRGMGGAQPVEERMADFRDVAGLKLPFKTTILQEAKVFSEAVVRDAKINLGLSAEELSKKP